MFKRTLLAASLGLAALASAQAMAVTGGGASLPADLYKSTVDGILPSNFSYAVTGSGTGKSAFLTNNSALFSTTGTVHFAGSDSILSGTELTNYNNNFSASYGPLIQVPSVATSVTIPYKKAGNTTLNLTSQQLCDAFSGAKTTWGALLNTTDSTPIRIVYRNVSSGTSELLTRHLNSVCSSQFGVSSTFTSARLAGGTLPSNWVGVAETADVVGQVNAVDGSIGYVSPDMVNIDSNAEVAQVNGKLPTRALVTQALASSAVPADAVKNNPAQWVPVFTNPAAGYPIVGYTNFIFGQCYKDANVAADVRAFITKHWGGNTTATAVRDHGFIALTSGWKTAVHDTFVSNTSGLNLDINNANVCNASVGRP
ncbi:substrate-binding domain-containing protein [Pseudomonas sp. 148P]|uniref:Phosphate-binding protein PstS n=1 Tax=Pseudomonas ulcerans TaxID=3115852 RepID=A0ABU7HL60_9PSED|nr:MULTISPECIES: substrate-binding domain-containing protein [unclassified Pseudomonas]MEE1920822.1 substrate-binding domain-containing protein [Pseudomonas sp. 147P]MEE1932277.1 substrate-binding domain-containing protein [Pseudomonas sp. 148P]